MSEVFISYARSTEAQARQIGEALRALGYGVWRDDEIPAHRAFAEVIEERLSASKAVIVLWSAAAVASEWVRSEANRARTDRKLIQLRMDETRPPMPFDQLQCADLVGWSGDADHPGWVKVAASVEHLVGVVSRPKQAIAAAVANRIRSATICVLPFANMSGDAEQEYFSDGISEDIITDLSKVSALQVTARNSAFAYKGKSPDLRQVARELNVSHVLEGSVRKAGNRVRISAQLIDGATGNHLWAERYDRDLTDIFALQDEVTEAIVAALKLKLLPEEKQAIERRGTDSVEAYDLYLMARQHSVSGNAGDPTLQEAIVRLAGRAVEIDPSYALAWTLLGRAQSVLRFRYGRREIDSWTTVNRALALEPDLAEAHALKAAHLRFEGRFAEASAEAEAALRLDPESYEANFTAGLVHFNAGRFAAAVPYYEKAAALLETDFISPATLASLHAALGDGEQSRRAVQMALARAEAVLAQDPGNGAALGIGGSSLAKLGEAERARDWVRRALLIDPDNLNMRYNLACALSACLKDIDGAIDLIGPFLTKATHLAALEFAKIDPDLDSLRDDPRFQAMIADAEARLAAEAVAVA